MNGSEFFGYWLRLKRKSLDLTREELAERVGNESSGDLCEMLVTIQEYAHERLRQSGEETEVHNWHLAYFLGVAEKADKELY